MNDLCPLCRGRLDPSTAGYTSRGLVCQLCYRDEMAADQAQSAEGNGDDGQGMAMNAIGLGLLAATGVGFTSGRGLYSGEAAAKHDAMLRQRILRRRARNTVYLRRGELERGPFNMAELAELWEAGHIQPTDEFRYPGMGDWRPVTEWDPAGE
ncbi:MAG: DUF4339 domain-containing protein [Myxococcales bacterium]|nr:DUF4339 domain-containing protein [Myxococcales bacterium]